MLIGYLFDNRLLRFKEDSTFLLLCTNAAICDDFGLPKNIRSKVSALTVWPRNKKSEFPPLCSLLCVVTLSVPYICQCLALRSIENLLITISGRLFSERAL